MFEGLEIDNLVERRRQLTEFYNKSMSTKGEINWRGVVIHEVIKSRQLESVWRAYKRIVYPRLYLKLKQFKKEVARGEYILYRTENQGDRMYHWYYRAQI